MKIARTIFIFLTLFQAWHDAEGTALSAPTVTDLNKVVPMTNQAIGIDWNPKGDHLAAAFVNGWITVFDGKTGHEVWTRAESTAPP